MPSKSVVSVAVIDPSSPNAIRKRELPLKEYYLVTSQRVTTRDHEDDLSHGSQTQ